MKAPDPSGTAVILKEAVDQFEILLVRRSTKLSFHGGAWVFPGGRVEQTDYTADDNDLVGAAKNAAVRETWEEAGIHVYPEHLTLMSRWTTPEGLPKRFIAWFFVTTVTDDNVDIDHKEISDYQWIGPAAALQAQGEGILELPPPTFVTLLTLSEYENPEAVRLSLSEKQPMIFVPKIAETKDGLCFLYEGDDGYEQSCVEHPGARHRLWMTDNQYRYERTGL